MHPSVRFEAESGCAACLNNAACGNPGGERPLPRTGALRRLDASADHVRVSVSAEGLLRLAALCFLLTPGAMVFGAWLIQAVLGGGDLAAAAGAATGLVVGCGALWLYDASGGGRHWAARVRLEPVAGHRSSR